MSIIAYKEAIRMGLNIRRSIKIGKHTRLNLSKSGVGISTGVKGARVSIGPRGVRKTIGIPGTGIYYTKQSSYKKQQMQNQIIQSPQKMLVGAIFKLFSLALIIAGILAVIGLWPLSILILFTFAGYFIYLAVKMIKAKYHEA